jgi:hypothetical protein
MLGLAPSKNLLSGTAWPLDFVFVEKSCDMTVNDLSGLRGEYRVAGTLLECQYRSTSAAIYLHPRAKIATPLLPLFSGTYRARTGGTGISAVP